MYQQNKINESELFCEVPVITGVNSIKKSLANISAIVKRTGIMSEWKSWIKTYHCNHKLNACNGTKTFTTELKFANRLSK